MKKFMITHVGNEVTSFIQRGRTVMKNIIKWIKRNLRLQVTAKQKRGAAGKNFWNRNTHSHHPTFQAVSLSEFRSTSINKRYGSDV